MITDREPHMLLIIGISEHVGLPRAIEALHSFMWPNLVRLPLPSLSTSAHATTSEAEEDEESYEEGLSLTDLPGGEGEEEGGTYEDALEQLEAWLEEDREELRKAAEAEDASIGLDGAGRGLEAGLGGKRGPIQESFEDDFADYVEASPAVARSAVAAGSRAESDEDEDGLPPASEIAAAHARIFGPLPPSTSHTLSMFDGLDEDGDLEDQDSDEEGERGGTGDFDLASAFSALSAMREEISGITDDGERRRRAAAVAVSRNGS